MSANTIDALKLESKRLRALADDCDALIAKLEGRPRQRFYGGGPVVSQVVTAVSHNNTAPSSGGRGEYQGMTQKQAILHALKAHGPQSTRELWQRLNSAGYGLREPTYVAAIVNRMKEQVKRDPHTSKLHLTQLEFARQ